MSIFDEIAAEIPGQRRTPAGGALEAVRETNPDEEARRQRAARRAGAPVNNTLSAAELEARARSLGADFSVGAILRPATAGFLARTERAAVAHDDTDNLNYVEGLLAFGNRVADVSGATRARRERQRQAAERQREANDGAFYDSLRDAFGGIGDFLSGTPGANTEARRARQRSPEARRADRALGYELSPSALGRRFVAGVMGLESSGYGIAQGALDGVGLGDTALGDYVTRRRREWSGRAAEMRPVTVTHFGGAVGAGVESIPATLGAAAVTFATRNPWAGAAVMGGLTGGDAYGEARDAGLTFGEAAVKATIDAGIETGTERLPLGRLLGDVTDHASLTRILRDQLATEIPTEQLATLGQDLNQWALVDRINGRSFEDYYAAIPDRALTTLVASTVTTGAMTAAAMPGRVALRFAPRMERMDVRAGQAEQGAQLLGQIVRVAEASRLRERDPATFAEFVDEAADGTAVTDIYVSADTLGEVLNQEGIDPEVRAAAEAVLGPRIEEAREQGTDVRVPIGDFAALAPGLLDTPALLDNIKTDPNGMTRAEATQIIETQGAALREEMAQVAERIAVEDEFAASREQVKQAILGQLQQAGRFRPDVNERYAELHASFFATLAHRMGTTPTAMYQRFPLRVQSVSPAGEALDQNKPPALYPAVRYKGKIYRSVGDHLSAISQIPDEEGRAAARMDGENRGFVTERGRYLDRYAAQQYARDFGLIREDAPEWARTSPELISENLRKDAYEQGELAPFDDTDALPETIEVDGQQRPTTNSNGQPLALTEEGVRNFWRWFGESKVVDEQGRPLVVYHGSKTAGFTTFRTDGRGKTDGTGAFFTESNMGAFTYSGTQREVEFPASPADIAADPAKYGWTVEQVEDGWRAEDPETGFDYVSSESAEQAVAEAQRGAGEPARAGNYAVYLKIERPDYRDFGGKNWNQYGADEWFIKDDETGETVGYYDNEDEAEDALAEYDEGFSIEHSVGEEGLSTDDIVREARFYGGDTDGVIFTDVVDEGPHGQGYGWDSKVYVVFDPTQIKSAIGNSGAFDPDDPNILRQDETPVFYSALERAIEQTKQAKASGDQWLATLRKTPGVKAEELEWTELPEWLAAQSGPVTRDELLAFVRAGGVRVEEVVLGAIDEDSYVFIETENRFRDEWIQGELDEWEFDSSEVDYPEISYDEDDDTWSVDGNWYDTEAEAQEAADELHDEWVKEAEEEARRAQEEYLAEVAPSFVAEVREALGGDEGTKFESYTEDGGEDYRELLLTLPEGEAGNPERAYFESAHFGNYPVLAHIRFKSRRTVNGESVMFVEEIQSDWHQKGREKGYARAPNPAEVDAARAALDEGQMRFDVAIESLRRAMTESRQEALVEEIARAERLAAQGVDLETMGVMAPDEARRVFGEDTAHLDTLDGMALISKARREIAQVEIPNARTQRIAEARERAVDAEADLAGLRYTLLRAENPEGVPDAPLKSSTDWAALAMKRAIRWAADNGFEHIAWTTGAQQAERYNLAETIGEVMVAREGDLYRVMTPSNARVIAEIESRGLGASAPHGGTFAGGTMMTAEQIAEVFGRDLGGRMVQSADSRAPSAEALARVADAEAAEKAAWARFEEAERDWRRARDGYLRADIVQRLFDATKEAESSLDAAKAELSSARAVASAASTAVLDGEDLKIGGEGMTAFYERILVNVANKLIKKAGGKVEMVAVEGMAERVVDEAAQLEFRAASDEMAAFRLEVGQTANYVSEPFEDFARVAQREAASAAQVVETLSPESGVYEAWKGMADTLGAITSDGAALRATYERGREIGERLRVAGAAAKTATTYEGANPGFRITDEIRAQAQAGYSLFQKQRGAFSPATSTITLLQAADLSTFLHESGHFFLEVMSDLAADPSAPQQIRDDFAALLKWFGVKDVAAWQGMTLDQKREHHETFARGTEAYLYTGKAPSMRLREIFRTFRSWLVSIYRSARNLNVTVSPEVRGVLDRMLATDEQIAEAEASRSMAPLFENREASGMSEDQWRAYQALGAEATATATEELERRSLRDMRWLANARGREVDRLKKQAKATRAAVTKSVAQEVQREPVYAALAYIKTGKVDGQKVDGPHRLYTPEIEALYPGAARDVVMEALRGMTSTENGVHPDQLAELFGFSSGDHLIREIMAAEPMAERVAGLAEQRMLEEHGDLTDEQSIEEAADRAVHNEARTRFVAAELAALAKASKARESKVDVLTAAARNYAAEAIARIRVRDLRPAMYEAAAQRAGKAATEQMRKGNLVAASAEKRNQLINLHLARAARKAQTEVEKGAEYLRGFLRPNPKRKIDAGYLQQIEQLLAAVDMRKSTTGKELDRRQSLREWIEKQRELGFEPVIPDDLLESLGQRSWKELTVEELRGLIDSVKNIAHLGRLKNKLLTAKRDREFASAVAAIETSIRRNAVDNLPVRVEQNRLIDRIRKGWLDFLAIHRKLASLARTMDGSADGGAVWEYFIRPMNAAGDREATMRAAATTRISEILAPVLAQNMGKRTFIPTLGLSLSLEGRLAIALNMGNAVNRERLMLGDNWTPDDLDAIAATLTAEQWGVVQAVWDYANSYWPQIAAKEMRVTGVAPGKVEADPLRVPTADGGEIELAGGYYPVKYDADRSTKAEADNLAEAVAGAMRGLYTRATTRRGHTKARVEKVERPVRKDLGVLVEHVNQVIHDLAWHEYLIDASRLLRAGAVDSAIRDHYGPEVLRAMRSALDDIAAGEVPAANSFERAIAHLRSGATIAGMGWSLSTALLQPLGLSQTVVRLGPRWAALGIARTFSRGARLDKTVAWVRGQSAFMAARGLTQQREINEIMGQVRSQSGTIDAVRDTFFVLIARFQTIVDVPTWIGGYEKAMAEGNDHDRAVALADQAVLDSQGGGQIKDLAAVQRGGPLMKLWTNFYSYFNVSYNLLAESVAETRRVGPARLPLLAADFLMLTAVPAALAAIVRGGLRGDDEDEVWSAAAKEALLSPLQLMVGVRDLAGVIGSDGRQTAPAGIVLNRAGALVQQTQQGEVDAGLLKAINNAAGVLLHYPSGQVQRTVEGAYALADGQTSNPLALLLGPPREAR